VCGDMEEYDYEADEDILLAATIGCKVKGDMYIVTYTCPFCHASMQTVSVTYSEHSCSHCKAKRNCRVKMDTSFECLETE